MLLKALGWTSFIEFVTDMYVQVSLNIYCNHQLGTSSLERIEVCYGCTHVFDLELSYVTHYRELKPT